MGFNTIVFLFSYTEGLFSQLFMQLLDLDFLISFLEQKFLTTQNNNMFSYLTSQEEGKIREHIIISLEEQKLLIAKNNKSLFHFLPDKSSFYFLGEIWHKMPFFDESFHIAPYGTIFYKGFALDLEPLDNVFSTEKFSKLTEVYNKSENLWQHLKKTPYQNNISHDISPVFFNLTYVSYLDLEPLDNVFSTEKFSKLTEVYNKSENLWQYLKKAPYQNNIFHDISPVFFNLTYVSYLDLSFYLLVDYVLLNFYGMAPFCTISYIASECTNAFTHSFEMFSQAPADLLTQEFFEKNFDSSFRRLELSDQKTVYVVREKYIPLLSMPHALEAFFYSFLTSFYVLQQLIFFLKLTPDPTTLYGISLYVTSSASLSFFFFSYFDVWKHCSIYPNHSPLDTFTCYNGTLFFCLMVDFYYCPIFGVPVCTIGYVSTKLFGFFIWRTFSLWSWGF